MSSGKPVKLDRFNRHILATLHLEANLSNVELAERIGLSPSACFQRVKALREAGYFVSFHAEVELDRICNHVLAYVEFKLRTNAPAARRKFTQAVRDIPELMDCLRLTGDVDYISFACCSDMKELQRICDDLASDPALNLQRVEIRVILERAKWFLGYPVNKLKWLEQ